MSEPQAPEPAPLSRSLPEPAPLSGSLPEPAPPASLPPLDPQVAEVLQALRSGVRQRHAEAVTMGGLSGGISAGLLAVRSHEYVLEPVPFSHRARAGRLIVWVRKAFFHLFLKWLVRPLVEQQNAFNQAAARLLQELAEAEERTARETRLLAARLDEPATREPRDARGPAHGGGDPPP